MKSSLSQWVELKNFIILICKQMIQIGFVNLKISDSKEWYIRELDISTAFINCYKHPKESQGEWHDFQWIMT